MKEFKSLNGYSVKDETARNEIKTIIESDYINGISMTSYRDEISSTDYFITEIDSSNKPILGVAKDDNSLNSVESTIDFAHRKDASVCINAGIFYTNTTKKPYGYVIKDGVVLQDEIGELTQQYKSILAIDSEGKLSEYPTGGSVTPEELVENGVINAVTGYYAIIKNKIVLDTTDFMDTEAHPRQVIAQKEDGSYVIFTCEGRTEENKGMTIADVQRILTTYNVDFAFVLDGGGSASLIYKGKKVNDNIDDDKRSDRQVPTFIYFTKETEKDTIRELSNRVGKVEFEQASDKITNEINDCTHPFLKDILVGNLFNRHDPNNVFGYYDNDDVLTQYDGDDTVISSDLIRIIPNIKLIVTGCEDFTCINYYDKDKKFLFRTFYEVNTPFKTPSNACYCRVVVRNSKLDVFQIEVGEVATTYKPFANVEKGEVIFYNENGSVNGALLESISKYRKVKVYYKNKDSHYGSVEIYTNNTKNQICTSLFNGSCPAGTSYYGTFTRLILNDKQFTQDRQYDVTFNASSNVFTENTTNYSVISIVGF